jgi:integrase/recombinase XerD
VTITTWEAIEKFLAHCQARNLKAITIAWYSDKLRAFASSYPKLPLKPEPIESFLAGIKGSDHTKHAYYRSLKAFYNFVTQRGRKPNPMAKVSAPRRQNKVMATVEAYELPLLLNAATSARDKALLTLLVDTGARATEVATLRRQAIKADYICVAGKSGERIIPISEETHRLLICLADPAREYVFVGERGPITRYGVYRTVRSCMMKAGITGKKLGPHRLRHTFGRFYLVAGGDTRSLQTIMGHKNLSTTERYASLAQAEISMKHHRFSPLITAHAAAQASLFEPDHSLKEVEAII